MFIYDYNLLPAVGLCDVAKRKGSPAFIHTVGNSQLGQMMVKLARWVLALCGPTRGLPIVGLL